MRAFPAVLLTGPRRSGKTTLLRRAFPRVAYHLLEDPDLVARLRADPRGFLDGLTPPVILDEVQNVPEILNDVRARVDRAPRRMGQWLLIGSQESPLMQGVSESMAGRVAVLQLLPFSTAESPRVTPVSGGYPEVLARPGDRALWFASYIQTYLERDVRAITAIRDLATFRRLLALVATRTGQMLNRSDIAAPLGVSVPAVSQWLSILEITGQVFLIPPYFQNLGKRLVKAPKIYLADSGMACHLLGIETAAALDRSPFLGAIWEGFVVSEIVKQQLNQGRRRAVYYFRDQQGLEVDFVVPTRDGRAALIEARASRTALPKMADGLARLGAAASSHGVGTDHLVVFRPTRDQPTMTLRPGAAAAIVARIAAPPRSRVAARATATSAAAWRRRPGSGRDFSAAVGGPPPRRRRWRQGQRPGDVLAAHLDVEVVEVPRHPPQHREPGHPHGVGQLIGRRAVEVHGQALVMGRGPAVDVVVGRDETN